MITLPLILAVLSAGLIGGFHCVGMCGGIASLLSNLPQVAGSESNKYNAPGFAGKVITIHATPAKATELATFQVTQFLYACKLHVGRLTTYALIGAVFGGVGATSLQWKADLPITTVFFVLGNVALVVLGLRLLGLKVQTLLPVFLNNRIQSVYGKLMPTMQKGSQHPYLLGLTWGCLPCGLSYAIAPFALLSGAAWSGAVLMVVFGLAALPHLLIAQKISRQLKANGLMVFVQMLFALVLIGMGLAGLFYFDMKNMPDFLCITPRY
ncbi:sulfite exporter TauE/SafE family protein [Undibacterium sp. Di24W]|uniref:sulfite exporter TauE/SafE family protein n=1 Tax=Undibacterium sp. Di24W TaxID=3413033 RepID=UPI003BEFE08E